MDFEAPTPSPGTPGEGWGEGFLHSALIRTSSFAIRVSTSLSHTQDTSAASPACHSHKPRTCRFPSPAASTTSSQTKTPSPRKLKQKPSAAHSHTSPHTPATAQPSQIPESSCCISCRSTHRPDIAPPETSPPAASAESPGNPSSRAQKSPSAAISHSRHTPHNPGPGDFSPIATSPPLTAASIPPRPPTEDIESHASRFHSDVGRLHRFPPFRTTV
jgi:hypothetical protein